MEFHDALILLMISAVVVYVVGRLLIRAWWSSKRIHQRNLFRSIYSKEEEPS